MAASRVRAGGARDGLPDPTESAVLVLGSPPSRLQLGGSRAGLESLIQNGGRVDGWLVDGHPIVQVGYGTRSGSTQWRFDLDAPCET
jgi:hypothetical protein